MSAPGYEKIEKLREAGYGDNQIAEWQTSATEKFVAAGYTDDQIADYFGMGPIDHEPIQAALKEDPSVNFVTPASEEGGEEVREARGFIDGVTAGYQTSISGLANRGTLPDVVLGEDTNVFGLLGNIVGQAGGDLPISLPAFVAGFQRGAPIGAAASVKATKNPATGASTGALVGGLMMGEAVSGFVTEGQRSLLIRTYRKNAERGQPVTAGEFARAYVSGLVSQEVLSESAKAGAVGLATGAAGGATSAATLPLRNKALRDTIISSAEMSTALVAASAMEGEMPDQQDFVAAAAFVLGVRVADGGYRAVRGSDRFKQAQSRVEDIYADTGIKPDRIMEIAQQDPVLRQQIITGEGFEPKNSVILRAATDAGEDALPITQNIDAVNAVDSDHSKYVVSVAPGVLEPNRVTVAKPEGQVTTLSDANASILNKVQAYSPPKGSAKKALDHFRFKYINELQHVVTASNDAYKSATGNKLDVYSNPGELMRLAYGAHAIAERDIREGIFVNSEGGTKKIAYGLEEIIKTVADDYDDFVAYSVSRRVLEQHKKELDTGFDVLDAQLVVQANRGNKKFEAAFDNLQRWSNRQLTKARDAGLISEEGLAKMLDQNRNYVPFFRTMMEDNGKNVKGVSSRGIPVRNPVKKFTGSGADILDPMEVMVKNRYAIEQIIQNNIARQRLLEFNASLPEQFQFLEAQPKRITVLTISKGDKALIDFIEENGLDPEDVTGMHLYRAVNKRLGEGEFVVFDGGEPVVYKAADPDLVNSLMSVDKSTADVMTKFFKRVNTVLRVGVTVSPDFVIKSSVRDQLGAILQNQFTVVPLLTTVEGMYHIHKRDGTFMRWINSGGANSALLDVDKRVLRDMTRPSTRDLAKSRFWRNAVMSPFQLMSTFSTMMENATRVGRFAAARREGLPDEIAALQSRDVVLDFARMGASVRTYNSITAFMGAAINGIDRFNTAFTRAPAATLTKAAIGVTLPSVLLWLANKDEEWYQDLPDWERSLFWHMDIGVRDKVTGRAVPIRIPMPHQFGAVFGYAPVKMYEAFEKDNPQEFKEMADAIRAQFSIPVIPTAVSPIAQVALNHNFMTGNQLVSDSQLRVLPEYRYSPYTTQMTKELAKTLHGMGAGDLGSPTVIEHLVRGYTGKLGFSLYQGLDGGLRSRGIVPNIPKPSDEMADDPVFGFFFTRNTRGGEELDDFYRNVELHDQIKNSIRQEASRDPLQVDRILNTRGMPLMIGDKGREAISNLRKIGYMIHFDPEMPPDEKRQLLDEIARQQTAIAREFNKQFDSMREMRKEGEL